MQRHTLKPKTKRIKKMLVGRGGKRGKTAGRGTKGQKARAGAKIRPEIRDYIKKLPKQRGRGVNSNKSIKNKSTGISLTKISKEFSAGDIVSPSILFRKNLIAKVSGRLPVVKILATGEIDKKVTIINCLISQGAKEKIEKAGGNVK